MTIIKDRIKNNQNYSFLFFFIVSYLVVSTFIFINFFPLINSDYFSYLNISQKYADGHFKEAINAYWSPLVSWLLIPLVKWNLFYLKDIMVINFISGFFLILISSKLIKQYNLVGRTKFFFMLCIFIFSICYQILYSYYPDFLSAVCLIAYIVYITDEKNKTNRNYYFYTSLFSILCIFGKSFYAYFIILHLLCSLLYLLYKKEKSIIQVTNLIKTLIAVIFAVFIWISLLSWKYEQFTFNSSGKYNFAIMTPNGIGEHFKFTHGLFPPPDNHSYSNWVDPTYYPIKSRNIFDNWDSFLYQVEIWKYNLGKILYSFSYFSYFKGFLILFMAIPLLLKKKQDKEKMITYFLSSIIIMCGYGLVFIEERYFIGAHILLFMGTFISALKFTEENNFQKMGVFKPWILLVISFFFMKILFISYRSWEKNYNKENFDFINFKTRLISLTFLQDKKIATSMVYDDYSELTCFELVRNLNCVNYGNIGMYDNPQQQYDDIKKYDVDFFLYFDCLKSENNKDCKDKILLPVYLLNKTPVYSDAKLGLSIYSMKPFNPY